MREFNIWTNQLADSPQEFNPVTLTFILKPQSGTGSEFQIRGAGSPPHELTGAVIAVSDRGQMVCLRDKA